MCRRCCDCHQAVRTEHPSFRGCCKRRHILIAATFTMRFARLTRGIAADRTNLFEGAIRFVKTMLPLHDERVGESFWIVHITPATWAELPRLRADLTEPFRRNRELIW